jgi:CRISPR-associated endonuclease/helicase Cas3
MDFATWFAGVHGYAPFPWQSSVAESWPDAIAIPTGAGKTAVIDAWLYRRITGKDAPLRLWYVVDRRVLVDEAFERAKRLMREVGADVEVIRLRGGVFDRQEMPRPDQAAIFCSTVDQFGSRLFFRGYGVGRSSLPLHAALAGIDVALVVDEAHISEPLLQTVAAAVARGAQVKLTPMSATLSNTAGEVLRLSDEDRKNPVLAKRLSARKLARLASAKPETEARALRKAGARSIAVWCNTVDMAEATARSLAESGETILVTGRNRLLDRDKLMTTWHPQLKSGAGESPTVFVVATQCLEVGVDWDFDALVTECADIAALRQRFGRLDRLGTRGTTQAAILKPAANPKVYGEAALKTWAWLGSIATDGVVNFGISALPSAPQYCTMPQPQAPRLLDAHLDAWSMTSVRSDAIPDVGPWLHGLGQEDSHVSVVWRDFPEDQSDWVSALRAMPPTEPETASVPVYLVSRAAKGNVPIIRWRGDDDVELTDDIAPGDVVIVPSGTEGLAPTPPTDVAEEAAKIAQKPRVRVVGPDIVKWQEMRDEMPKVVANHISRLGRCDVLPYPGGVVVAQRQATSVQSTQPVALKDHCEAVATLAATIASGCELSPELVETVRAAGWWHDAGKVDPRMQIWMGASGELLAKSGHTWSQMRSARMASGYPRGQRHELLSAELARSTACCDLAVHLIAAHHGHGRPLIPNQDATPIDVSLELNGTAARANTGQVGRGLEEMFWRMQSTHGYWGLALLQGIVVCTDHLISAGKGSHASAYRIAG